jgi:hypothetical protein
MRRLVYQNYFKSLIAIESAGNFELEKTYRATKSSIEKYAQGVTLLTLGQKEAAIASGTYSGALFRVKGALDIVRITTYSVVTGVKVLGAALLNAIPVIGQVLFVLSLLVEAWDKFFVSSDEKTKKKALEELKTVTENTAAAIKEYNKAQASTANLAARTQLMLTNQANSVVSLADAYLAWYESMKKVREEKEKEKSSTVGSLPTVEGLRDRRFAKAASLASDSVAVAALSNREGLFGYSKEIKETAKALDQLNKLSPQTVQGFLGTNKQIQEFKKLKPEEAYDLVANALKKAKKET